MSGAVNTGAPVLTTDRRIVLGDEVRPGAMASYRTLAATDGERHQVRDDLLAGAEQVWSAAVRRPLLSLLHVTDVQLADVNSPARFEFFNREITDPRFRKLIPTQRPYEVFTARTLEAMIATINRVGGAPVAGAPLSLAVSTGDAIDNGQWNELKNFLALFDGGEVTTSGNGSYEGVQRPDWPDDIFWRPDLSGQDPFQAMFGYPTAPGALAAAVRSFSTPGLGVPWLAAYGNHEGLIQGVGAITPALAAAMVGGRKPTSLPADLDRDAAYELFVSGAEVFFDGPMKNITADDDRRPVSRREFVEAHFAAGARPLGHGFGERNRRDGTAYYSYDVNSADIGGRYQGLRMVALDTTCLLGGADGSLDVEQFAWLESVLQESHSSYFNADGELVRGSGDDRLVVLFSHHGLDTLTNHRGFSSDGGLLGVGPEGHAVPVVPAEQIEAMLHRYPNMVLWLNGHTHTNGIRPRRSPYQRRDGSPGGFWEITTCSIIDWPNQTRIVELIDISTSDRAQIAVATTMLDHDSPLAPSVADGLWTPGDLTALHRELAGNVPIPGYGERLAGGPSDRNAILPLSLF